jgi:hypothetical protein
MDDRRVVVTVVYVASAEFAEIITKAEAKNEFYMGSLSTITRRAGRNRNEVGRERRKRKRNQEGAETIPESRTSDTMSTQASVEIRISKTFS